MDQHTEGAHGKSTTPNTARTIRYKARNSAPHGTEQQFCNEYTDIFFMLTWRRLYFYYWFQWPSLDIKAKPHGCCIFSMILHEAPSMETTTPKGEWFPCWVAEWSIMKNMQQQMWFCFYPSLISINISIYVYNALRLTPEILFRAMPFASFQIDINKYFAIVSPRCRVISNCDVMSPWITWQNNRLMISRFAIFSREYLLQTALCNR